LEGILGVVLVEQDTTADTHDHRSMPVEQCREGVTVALLDEKGKQLPIAQSATVLQKCGVANTVEKPVRHVAGPPSIQRGRCSGRVEHFCRIFLLDAWTRFWGGAERPKRDREAVLEEAGVTYSNTNAAQARILTFLSGYSLDILNRMDKFRLR